MTERDQDRRWLDQGSGVSGGLRSLLESAEGDGGESEQVDRVRSRLVALLGPGIAGAGLSAADIGQAPPGGAAPAPPAAAGPALPATPMAPPAPPPSSALASGKAALGKVAALKGMALKPLLIGLSVGALGSGVVTWQVSSAIHAAAPSTPATAPASATAGVRTGVAPTMPGERGDEPVAAAKAQGEAAVVARAGEGKPVPRDGASGAEGPREGNGEASRENAAQAPAVAAPLAEAAREGTVNPTQATPEGAVAAPAQATREGTASPVKTAPAAPTQAAPVGATAGLFDTPPAAPAPAVARAGEAPSVVRAGEASPVARASDAAAGTRVAEAPTGAREAPVPLSLDRKDPYGRPQGASGPGRATSPLDLAPRPPAMPLGPEPAAPLPPGPPRAVVTEGPPATGSASASPPLLRISDEAKLLHMAQESLVRSPMRAIQFLEEHRRRFPDGSLSQEREVFAIEALWRAGRRDAAAERAKRFLSAHPGSGHAARVRSLVGGK